MTENEAIKELSYDNTAYGGCCTEEVRRVAIQALEELQQYRAIGTIDEIKSFFNENRKAGYKHGYSDGYAKAIDDFAEKLMTDVESFVGEVNGIRADLLTLDYFCDFVGDTAEQMKGGAE